ncbi:unnamed protein product [Pleuronectes platessa]|uniref:Uncharacterized protein n=1 Tax=Pleuronectes platessa TaxID=8262 RepID=A0A9N7UYL7_PLEPL|nr:unnamed protein product [Pleuronectes platessa]
MEFTQGLPSDDNYMTQEIFHTPMAQGGPMAAGSCRERGVVFWVGHGGVVRVKGGRSTGKVIAGAPMQDHRFPHQRLRSDVHTPLAPLLLFQPPTSLSLQQQSVGPPISHHRILLGRRA